MGLEEEATAYGTRGLDEIQARHVYRNSGRRYVRRVWSVVHSNIRRPFAEGFNRV